MFRQKNILIISPEPWGTCFVSKHHYAVNLARAGNKVYFLSKNQESQKEIEAGLTLLNMPTLTRGLRFYPAFLRKYVHHKIGKLLSREANCNFDLIWSFDSSVLFDLDQVAPKAFRILHLVDLSMEFNWEIAAKSANLCLASSSIIQNRLNTANSNSHFIHHGVDIYETKDIRFDNNHKRVVYAGNLNIKYIDKPRLIKLVTTYPTVDFHFIGDQGTENISERGSVRLSETLTAFNNAIFHDAMSVDKLRNWLCSADVLLTCYNPIYYDQISNPHKVMEYLSCGKPILSTKLDEYKSLSDLIEMHDDLDLYINQLQHLLSESNQEKEIARKTIASNNTYTKQIERIYSLYINTLNNNN